MDTREAGRRGGLAHAKDRYDARGGQTLTLQEVKRKLPRLKDAASAQRRCELIGDWAAAALIPGTVAGAMVRSVEVWLKIADAALDWHKMEQLEKRIHELEKELAQARRAATAQGTA